MKPNYLIYYLFLIIFIGARFAFSQNTFQTLIGGPQDEYSPRIISTQNNEYFGISTTYSFGSGDRDIFLFKLDSAGQLIWSKVIGSYQREIIRGVIKNNNNYIILAWERHDGATIDDWYILKISESGNIISEKFIGGDHDDELHCFDYINNNEYILGGNSWTYAVSSGADILITKMNSDLEFSWSKIYGTDDNETIRSIKICSDGGYIMAGRMQDYYGGQIDNLIIKTDSNGDLEWAFLISGDQVEEAWDIIETEEQNYLMVGYTNSFGAGGYDIFITKFDGLGNLIWSKAYGGQGDDKAYNIKKTDYNTYLISAVSSGFGAGGSDLILLEIDTDGNFIKGNAFGGEQDEEWGFFDKAYDGGYIIAGNTESFDSEEKDIFIVKTDSEGNSCCGEEIESITIQNVNPDVTPVNFSVGSGITTTSHNMIINDVLPNYTYLCIDYLQIIGEDSVCAFDNNIKYTISPQIPFNLTWILPEGASISINQNDTTIYVNFGNTSGYIYLQSNGCDDSILDSLYINISEMTPPELGNDTTLCTNEGLLLDPGTGYSYYLWQDGSIDSTYLADTTGLYWVEVTNEYGCSAIDSIFIELLPSPEINLGNDTLICAGDSLILNAGSGFISYLWSTGSADSVIVVDTSGVFWVEVTNEFGCSSIDSIFIDYYPFAFEDLELGNDTSFCYGDVFVLNAGTGYTYYEWQNGSHDSIFIADTTGVYWVYVSNPCGEAWDTINLSLYPITEIDLGNDTAVCFGEFILLDPGADFISYLWHNGSTNQFIYAGQTGTYWVQVTDSNYCTVTDSVYLEFILPDPDIGNDTTICFGDTITFFALDEFVSYLWQDGSVGLSFTADTAGIFWCEVIDTMGCVGVDSVCLNLIYPPLVSLGNDTSICTGDSVWLSVGLSGGDYEILWHNGSSDSAFITSESGIYWVQVSNICGMDTDSVYVTLLPLPEIFLGNDIIIGIRDDILLDAGSGFESYLWNNGSTGQTLTVSDSGYYWVNVFDGQCYNSDTINIEPINCDMFIPIVFTPNGDIYNNYFYADASEDITDFELVVFNRWGEKIWETNDLYDKWDGTKNGSECAEGVYYWIVEYKCLGAYQNFILKGSVTLLR